MKKVVMIRFAMPVSKVLKNFQDLSFYRIGDETMKYLNVWYDGNDFIVENTHLCEAQPTIRKVYVAKTNVSQWELDDTDRAESDAGIPKEVRAEANAKTSRVSRAK